MIQLLMMSRIVLLLVIGQTMFANASGANPVLYTKLESGEPTIVSLNSEPTPADVATSHNRFKRQNSLSDFDLFTDTDVDSIYSWEVEDRMIVGYKNSSGNYLKIQNRQTGYSFTVNQDWNSADSFVVMNGRLLYFQADKIPSTLCEFDLEFNVCVTAIGVRFGTMNESDPLNGITGTRSGHEATLNNEQFRPKMVKIGGTICAIGGRSDPSQTQCYNKLHHTWKPNAKLPVVVGYQLHVIVHNEALYICSGSLKMCNIYGLDVNRGILQLFESSLNIVKLFVMEDRVYGLFSSTSGELFKVDIKTGGRQSLGHHNTYDLRYMILVTPQIPAAQTCEITTQPQFRYLINKLKFTWFPQTPSKLTLELHDVVQYCCIPDGNCRYTQLLELPTVLTCKKRSNGELGIRSRQLDLYHANTNRCTMPTSAPAQDKN